MWEGWCGSKLIIPSAAPSFFFIFPSFRRRGARECGNYKMATTSTTLLAALRYHRQWPPEPIQIGFSLGNARPSFSWLIVWERKQKNKNKKRDESLRPPLLYLIPLNFFLVWKYVRVYKSCLIKGRYSFETCGGAHGKTAACGVKHTNDGSINVCFQPPFSFFSLTLLGHMLIVTKLETKNM